TAVPASLDDGCARRFAKSWPGRRNTLGRTKKLICPVVKGDRCDDCLLTSTAPYKGGLEPTGRGPVGVIRRFDVRKAKTEVLSCPTCPTIAARLSRVDASSSRSTCWSD